MRYIILDVFKLAPMVENNAPDLENFKPYGAIAFFIVLIILCAVLWFGIYYLMMSRS